MKYTAKFVTVLILAILISGVTVLAGSLDKPSDSATEHDMEKLVLCPGTPIGSELSATKPAVPSKTNPDAPKLGKARTLENALEVVGPVAPRELRGGFAREPEWEACYKRGYWCDGLPYFYLTIPDYYGDDFYNMRFTPSGNGCTIEIIWLLLHDDFDEFSNVSGEGITVLLWEDDGAGLPGALIGGWPVAGADLVFYPNWLRVDIGDSHIFSDDFHVGFTVNNQTDDKIGIVLDKGSCGDLRSFEWYNGSWRTILADWGADHNFLIDVYMCCSRCGEEDCPTLQTENEICGGDDNGGCDMTVPAFEPINCGDSVCGTAYADDGTRDTDWYELILTEQTLVKMTVQSSFPAQVGFVEMNNPGSGDCADFTGSLNPYAFTPGCIAALGGWMSQTSGTTEWLSGVGFTDAHTGTAVGGLGTILRTTNGGTTWVSQTSGTTEWLSCVSFIDAHTGTAVGTGGTILRTTNGGATWVSQTSGTTQTLSGVNLTDANRGTVVGWDGTILRTTNGGTTWVSQTSGTIEWLRDVYFTDANIGTAVGTGGTILRTTNGGTTWVSQTSGTTQALSGVNLTDANNGTVVGGDGTILRTTNGGTTWVSQTSGTIEWLSDVYFTDANIGTAVGAGGTILQTTNGGTTWLVESVATTQILSDISVGEVNSATVVGANGTILRRIDPVVTVEADLPPGTHWLFVAPDGYNEYPIADCPWEYWVTVECGSDCCADLTGNVDNDSEDICDIGDLTKLINYLFIPPFPVPVCMAEANCDGGGTVDIGDLTTIINYLFIPPFDPPAACP